MPINVVWRLSGLEPINLHKEAANIDSYANLPRLLAAAAQKRQCNLCSAGATERSNIKHGFIGGDT